MRRTPRKRTGAAGLVLGLFLATAALAQEPEPYILPPVVVRPPHPLQGVIQGNGSGEGTTDKPGDAKSFERLNRELKRKVDEINPSPNAPPLDAQSPDIKIGVVNIPAVQQQYGQNFGRSAIPYRPPPLIYNSPLGRR